MRKIVAGSAVVLVASLTHVAAADNTNCVYSPGLVNAPDGALIVNQGANPNGTDPVTAVLTAVGEQSTHSVISHGTYGADSTSGSWASMDTMVTPQQYPNGDSSCGAPVDAIGLADGQPGARTDNAGGLFAYYFGSGGWMAGQNYIKYITPDPGTGDSSTSSCVSHWEKDSMAGCGGNCLNGHGYSVNAYQELSWSGDPNYLDITSASQYNGDPYNPPNYTGGAVQGTMCSGLTATSYYNSGCAGSGARINEYVYSNSQVVNATYALYNTIQNNTQGFWGTLGACIACFDCNLLDEAGDQVVEAFAYFQVYWFGDGYGDWWLQPAAYASDHSWASNGVSGLTASSVSPDRLAGFGVHAPSNDASNNSPWAQYAANDLQFNSGGSYYGCWHE